MKMPKDEEKDALVAELEGAKEILEIGPNGKFRVLYVRQNLDVYAWT